MTIYSQIAKNKLRTAFIISLFVLFISFFFYAVGLYFNDPYTFLIFGFIFALFSSFGSYFWSDKIVLATVRAHPADKKEYFDLYTVCENLAIADGLPMPKVYVIDDPAPNAFATGRNPKHAVVCATSGILERLNRAELEGVIAHELSHIKNYDILVISIVAVLVGTVALAADMIMRAMWWGGGDDSDNRNPLFFILFIVVLIISPIVATLIQLAVSRRREYLADASGALLTRNPDALARALEKISADPTPLRSATSSTAHLFIANPLKNSKVSNWFASLFNTHPPTEERIRILHEM